MRGLLHRAVVACLGCFLVILLLLAAQRHEASSDSTAWQRVRRQDGLHRTSTRPTSLASQEPLDGLAISAEAKEKFLIRDLSLHLGLNNVRHILSASLHMAEILNRTLVVPSSLFLRTCNVQADVCARFGHSAVLEDKKKTGVPMRYIFDTGHLASKIKTATLEEFYKRFSFFVPPDHLEFDSLYLLTSNATFTEIDSDYWDMGRSFRSSDDSSFVLLDSETMIVDRLPVNETGHPTSRILQRFCKSITLPENATSLRRYDLEQAGLVYGFRSILEPEQLEPLQACLARRNLALTFSYTSPQLLHMLHQPETVLIRRDRLKGFVDDWQDNQSDILYLPDELHAGPVGAIFFASPQARDHYFGVSMDYIRPPKVILEAAKRIDGKLRKLTADGMVISAHLRRTDQAELSWVPDFNESLAQLEAQLADSRRHLSGLRDPLELDTPIYNDAPLPYTTEDGRLLRAPQAGSKFFLSTDEDEPENRERLAKMGAVFIEDLIDSVDYQNLGWPSLFTDYLGILSQVVAARSAYFIGSPLSSFSGTIVNLRIAFGIPAYMASFQPN